MHRAVTSCLAVSHAHTPHVLTRDGATAQQVAAGESESWHAPLKSVRGNCSQRHLNPIQSTIMERSRARLFFIIILVF